MDEKNLLRRIAIDPTIAGGQPCIRGTRIMVHLLLDFMAGGMSTEDLLTEYPQLEPEDIRAALALGADLARFGYTDLPTTAPE